MNDRTIAKAFAVSFAYLAVLFAGIVAGSATFRPDLLIVGFLCGVVALSLTIILHEEHRE